LTASSSAINELATAGGEGVPCGESNAFNVGHQEGGVVNGGDPGGDTMSRRVSGTVVDAGIGSIVTGS
jgi:hypothetical protein